MSNPIKKEYDKISLTKDIIERERIISRFQATGFLDRIDDRKNNIYTKYRC